MGRIMKAIICISLLLPLASCTVSMDGSTAIQEVFAYDLYDEGVYLDKGGLTLIVRQDRSATPLSYYLVEIVRLGEDTPSIALRRDYEDDYDLIIPLDIERGIYSFRATGYRETDGQEIVEACNGSREGYVLDGRNRTLEIGLLAKGHAHEITWQNDATHHWRGCSLCDYTEPDTKAIHQYPDEPESDGNYYCTVCNRIRPMDTSTSGFNAEESDIEPRGHFTGTREGTAWTFAFVDDNASYPSSVVAWLVDGKETEAAGDTLETTIETHRRALVLCVFRNGKGYGSWEAMIDGKWNEYNEYEI